jgi:hypothetical protein
MLMAAKRRGAGDSEFGIHLDTRRQQKQRPFEVREAEALGKAVDGGRGGHCRPATLDFRRGGFCRFAREQALQALEFRHQ